MIKSLGGNEHRCEITGSLSVPQQVTKTVPSFLGPDFASIVSYNEATYPRRVLDDIKSSGRDHARAVTLDDDLREDFVQTRPARFARPLLSASQLNQTASGHAPSRPAMNLKLL